MTNAEDLPGALKARIQGSNHLVETRTGIRCFTVGQLVGVEIKEA